MKKIIALIFLAVLTGCATPLPTKESFAEKSLPKVGEWTKVVSSIDGADYYVDTSTVIYSSTGYRYAKTLFVDGKGSVIGVGYLVDCRSRPLNNRTSIEDMVSFKNGKPINDGKNDQFANRQPFYDVVPGSVGESVTRLICSTSPISNFRKHYAEFHGSQSLTTVGSSQTIRSDHIGSNSIRCAENGSCYGDISANTGRPKDVYVNGYYRKDGTYVRGHYRSRPR